MSSRRALAGNRKPQPNHCCTQGLCPKAAPQMRQALTSVKLARAPIKSPLKFKLTQLYSDSTDGPFSSVGGVRSIARHALSDLPLTPVVDPFCTRQLSRRTNLKRQSLAPNLKSIQQKQHPYSKEKRVGRCGAPIFAVFLCVFRDFT